MIATTLVQSRHLLELGLDPSTADMHWFDIDGYNPHKNDWRLMCGHCDVADCSKGIYVPAWSLSALLEVMPKVIVHDMGKHVLCLKYAEGAIPLMYYVVENGRNKGKLIRFNNHRCAPDAGDALDAAYQMVCWLLEQGIIEKV